MTNVLLKLNYLQSRDKQYRKIKFIIPSNIKDFIATSTATY